MGSEAFVLIADDDEATRTLVARWLEEAGLEVKAVSGGHAAIEQALSQPEQVAAIVLDAMMPGLDGFAVLARLKNEPNAASIPVVMLTAHATGESEVLRAVESGAADHVSKPFSGPVLVAKIKNLVRKRAAERDQSLRLARAEAEAARDSLTGLYNRRQFTTQLTVEMSYIRRHGTPCTLALIDLDLFKSVNDLHGHASGDQVLVHFARVLRSNLRAEDVAFRIGGEEFALLLRATDGRGAEALLSRLRNVLRNAPVALEQTSYQVRFSAGVASLDDSSPDSVLRRADEALYAAKRAGRDRTVLA